MLGGERVIEEVAYALGRDPLEIRKANFYGGPGRDVTPYHQTVEDNIIARIVEDLEASSDYQARRAEIIDFNETSPVVRRGIALTPVKFGISFTATWYNQAGALVHVYQDGSIHLNHGGTEMGQGLNTKGGAGAGRGVPSRSRHDPHHRHHHRKGAQHIRHGGIIGH